MHEWRCVAYTICVGACGTDLTVDRWRTTTEDSNFIGLNIIKFSISPIVKFNLLMSGLKEWKEGSKIGSTKVICGSQIGKHTSTSMTTEMFFTDVENGCTQVKFVEELSNKHMHFQNSINILSFNISQHVHKPFKVFVCWANPKEVDLKLINEWVFIIYWNCYFFTSHIAMIVAVFLFNQIHQNWGIRCNANSTANHHGNIVVLPFL